MEARLYAHDGTTLFLSPYKKTRVQHTHTRSIRATSRAASLRSLFKPYHSCGSLRQRGECCCSPRLRAVLAFFKSPLHARLAMQNAFLLPFYMPRSESIARNLALDYAYEFLMASILQRERGSRVIPGVASESEIPIGYACMRRNGIRPPARAIFVLFVIDSARRHARARLMLSLCNGVINFRKSSDGGWRKVHTEIAIRRMILSQ